MKLRLPMFKRRVAPLLRTAALAACMLALSLACKPESPDAPEAPPAAPTWARAASIYEVNLRQYTPEGTFRAFQERLPDLQALGVEILWLMPIHPIGAEKRKGTMGSYYAVQDYKEIHPDLGTKTEFKALVNRIHSLGMRVILDWVANHTAWDHSWIRDQPDWYTRGAEGRMQPPVPDWSDVADLNYDNAGLRDAMLNALEYWVREFDIDGYRCDVADMVPIEFWERVSRRLAAIKPVFLLAESESPALHGAGFHMTYAWGTHHLMRAVYEGKSDANTLAAHLETDAARFPPGAMRMQFTSNHDENSWNGTVYERLGDGAAAFAVLAATVPDMPLIYSGQEAGLDKRLAFFEKDLIPWRDHPFRDLYSRLNRFKQEHSALHNGAAGGTLVRVPTDSDAQGFFFLREQAADTVFVALNLSSSARTFTLLSSRADGTWDGLFDEASFQAEGGAELALPAWGYRVFARR